MDGFDTDRDSFLGKFNSWETPATVEEGISNNSVASGWAPMASHRIDVNLEAGEERAIIFCLGYIENPEAEKFEEKRCNQQEACKRSYCKVHDITAGGCGSF